MSGDATLTGLTGDDVIKVLRFVAKPRLGSGCSWQLFLEGVKSLAGNPGLCCRRCCGSYSSHPLYGSPGRPLFRGQEDGRLRLGNRLHLKSPGRSPGGSHSDSRASGAASCRRPR